VQRPDRVERAYADGLTEPYVRFVERGRMHLRDSELILAESYFELASEQSLFERPNYVIWLELAETKCRLLKIKDAMVLLDDFDTALKVDFGEETCFSAGRLEEPEFRNTALSDRVFHQMCGEVTPLVLDPNVTILMAELPVNQAMKRRLEADSMVLRDSCLDIAHEPVHPISPP
jgi:hypothetical protein